MAVERLNFAINTSQVVFHAKLSDTSLIQMPNSSQQQYRTVLKSSSLIGGSTLVRIVIGMISTKFVAVLLGPAGVGLINMYSTITTTASTVAAMGMNTSGVRAVAEATGRNDLNEAAVVVKSIRKTVWITGIFGSIITAVIAPWLSQWTFGTSDHSSALMILSATVLFANILVGQSCLLQGKRRIADIAKISILGSLNGTIISIPCYYLWGTAGIVPSLLLTSIASLITSWYYARQIKIEDISVSWFDSLKKSRQLLKFGFPIMLNALQGALVAYFLRLVIMNQFGIEGVGIWSAAFAISGALVSFVLNAMGTDYYPRLSAVSHDNTMVSKEMNAQLEIALLLAAPAIIVTILFAPLGVEILYSGKFDGAVPILRWSVYGIFGRVVSWPLGFIILAKSRGFLLFATDLLSHIIHIALLYICGKYWGLPGTGIAFMINYTIYILVVICTSHIIAKTHIAMNNLKLVAVVTAALAVASSLHCFISSQVLYYLASVLLTAAITFFAFRQLAILTGITLSSIKTRFSR